MPHLARAAARSASQLRVAAGRQTRRNASDSHGHGHGHHSGPTTESFGPGFYVSIAAIPAAFALYKLTQKTSDGDPYFTRAISEAHKTYQKQFEDRNAIHTEAMERAAADKSLFYHEPGQNAPRHVNLRYPEIVNASSPYNVRAGHDSANMDQLIAKYQKEAYEQNEQKLQQLKDNTVPAEQPYETFRKIKQAAADS